MNMKEKIIYKMVDLGLTSGTLWADRNIGASGPEDSGLYFQWGDTKGYTADQVGTGEGKKAFTWDDYTKFGKYEYILPDYGMTKYNATDNKLTLDPEDDAAHVNMGGDWKMPTREQIKELLLETEVKLVLSDGDEINKNESSIDIENGNFEWESFDLGDRTVKGIKFINKSDSSKYIFVPAAGHAVGGSMYGVGDSSFLWSSSLYEGYCSSAWEGVFDFVVAGVGGLSRCVGLPVRGVINNLVK